MNAKALVNHNKDEGSDQHARLAKRDLRDLLLVTTSILMRARVLRRVTGRLYAKAKDFYTDMRAHEYKYRDEAHATRV